jgi:hypothetical protein
LVASRLVIIVLKKYSLIFFTVILYCNAHHISTWKRKRNERKRDRPECPLLPIAYYIPSG